MSGHSKWSKIKRQKGANDAKRGVMFTKLGKNISLAAREGGGDPDMNFKLRLAIDTAKKANMPLDNVDRAIKKGTGELAGEGQIQEVTYEGYGPGGVPVLVDVATENSNRSFSEIRKVFSDHGGKTGEAGSVSWQFKEIGLVTIRTAKIQKAEKYGEEDKALEADPEEVMLELMEVPGVIDIEQVEVEDEEDEKKYSGLEVQTERNSLSSVHKSIEDLGYIVENAEIVKVPDTPQSVDDETNEKVERLIEDLEDYDDVLNVWDVRKN